MTAPYLSYLPPYDSSLETSNTFDYASAPPPEYDDFFSSDYSTNIQTLTPTATPTTPNSMNNPYSTNNNPYDSPYANNNDNNNTTNNNNNNNKTKQVLPHTTTTTTTTTTNLTPINNNNKVNNIDNNDNNNHSNQHTSCKRIYRRILPLLAVLFPMAKIDFRSFNQMTLIIFIITLPFSLIISSLKALGAFIRNVRRYRATMDARGGNNGNNKDGKNYNGNKGIMSVLNQENNNVERFDILYTSLKKAAYNQYYANYNNYIAHRYQYDLTQWENDCKKIEKKNSGFFNRIRGKEHIPLPDRPDPPRTNIRLHQFAPVEIESLRSLEIIEGVDDDDTLRTATDSYNYKRVGINGNKSNKNDNFITRATNTEEILGIDINVFAFILICLSILWTFGSIFSYDHTDPVVLSKTIADVQVAGSFFGGFLASFVSILFFIAILGIIAAVLIGVAIIAFIVMILNSETAKGHRQFSWRDFCLKRHKP